MWVLSFDWLVNKDRQIIESKIQRERQTCVVCELGIVKQEIISEKSKKNLFKMSVEEFMKTCLKKKKTVIFDVRIVNIPKANELSSGFC